MIKSLKTYSVAIVILFVATASFASPVSADQNIAQATIASAQNNLRNCYEAAKQAQSAGANVDSLMAILNDAAESLSEAQLAYSSNDYGSAYTYAAQSQIMLEGFIPLASALQANANNVDYQNFITAVLSIVASVAVLSSGIGAWVTLDRKGRKS